MDEGHIDLGAALSAIWRRRVWVAGATAACLVAGLIHAWATPARFSATALVYVDPRPSNLLAPEVESAGATDMARIASAAEIMRSDAVLGAVVQAERLDADPRFASPTRGPINAALSLTARPAAPDPALRALDGLRAATGVEQRGQTHLVAVEVRLDDPQRAAHLANAVARTYIEQETLARTATIFSAGEILRERAEQAGRALQTTRGERDAQGAAQGGAAADPRSDLDPVEAIARTHYETLLARSVEFAARTDLQMPDARLVSPATPPARPSGTEPALILGFWGLIGLMLGTGAALTRETVAGGFAKATVMSGCLGGRPVIAIPEEHLDWAADQWSPADIVTADSRAPYAQALHRLQLAVRSALDRRGVGRGALIVVSSGAPGEGRSTLALALARSLAITGARTLLVDADGQADFAGALIPAPNDALPSDRGARAMSDLQSPLEILLARGSAVNDQPGRIPDHEGLAGVVEGARQGYDFVVVDTPPISHGVDALALGSRADAMVLVAQSQDTPRSVVEDAVHAIETTAPGLELVLALNRARPPRPRYRPGPSTFLRSRTNRPDLS
ncbi:Wzz/FepE/Etk N-terminal domain-containing protein [Pelagibacterium montanilacus]|uniref:Wzz/FepE/Etk N-terminal domain-containing protein n=1 Tax=Pelagibacterium montanilacus TaxID=2185280 RepID=UPI000F8D91D2|nr:Wzz/FepE/Etk N-terminal domain-containing protein [Pelagibacterium montanilacus]